MAQLILTKPFSPEERVVRYTEFLLSNGPIEELQLESANLNFIQIYNIDIYAIILSPLIIFAFALRKLYVLIFVRKTLVKNGKTKPKKE